MLKFGVATHNMVSDPERPLYQQIEETAELVRLMARLGTVDAIRAQHHWLSHPTIWIEPIPLLARLAPEAGDMRLMTSVIKPALHNPVELAHQVATMDHICNGRFILGIGTGYQKEELEAVGATRKERGARVEESLVLMKALWGGDEVTHEGRFWSVHGVRMGYTPVQKPHPPIWNAAQSALAARRAARLCDGILIAPQISWQAVGALAEEYRRAAQQYGKAVGTVGANRTISVARSYQEADKAARASAARSATYYGPWEMQEKTMPELMLDPARDPREWAIVGTPQDCVEQLGRHTQKIGLDFIGVGLTNWPKEHSARMEHVQYVCEEVFSKCR